MPSSTRQSILTFESLVCRQFRDGGPASCSSSLLSRIRLHLRPVVEDHRLEDQRRAVAKPVVDAQPYGGHLDLFAVERQGGLGDADVVAIEEGEAPDPALLAGE